MTQPDKPVHPRGSRPQLFGDAGASKSARARQPDFGSGILATIDGLPRREPRVRRDATPLKRALWMALLALGVVAMYFAVKAGVLRNGAAPAPEAAARPTTAMQVEPVVPAQPMAARGSEAAASIENAAPMPVVKAATGPVLAAAASPSNIQQALEQPDASRWVREAALAADLPRRAWPEVRPTASPSSRDRAAARAAESARKTPGQAARDGDAELLAAMLPHLKRMDPVPAKPADEKRCGPLEGDAAAACRARFCRGREGVDPACPSR